VRLVLTEEQVVHVIRDAAGGSALADLWSQAGDLEKVRSAVLPLLDDHRLSRSTLSSLLVFASLPADGSERRLKDVANELRLSPSTASRHLSTLRVVGLIERDPATRRYRRSLSTSGANGR
jgi:DNA-binding MarR family transcriptional regulator